MGLGTNNFRFDSVFQRETGIGTGHSECLGISSHDLPADGHGPDQYHGTTLSTAVAGPDPRIDHVPAGCHGVPVYPERVATVITKYLTQAVRSDFPAHVAPHHIRGYLTDGQTCDPRRNPSQRGSNISP